VNTAIVIEDSLAVPLATIERTPLRSIPSAQSARIVRRIVDNESLRPRLDVTAFNSAH